MLKPCSLAVNATTCIKPARQKTRYDSTRGKIKDQPNVSQNTSGWSLCLLVAGVGLEPTTFGLWARRASTAPPRDINDIAPGK